MQKINTLIIKPRREMGMLRQRPCCASLAETQEPAHTRFTTPDAHELLSASLAHSGVFYVTGHVLWWRLMGLHGSQDR